MPARGSEAAPTTRHSSGPGATRPRRGSARGERPSGAIIGPTRLGTRTSRPRGGRRRLAGASPRRASVTSTNRRRPSHHYSSCGRRRPTSAASSRRRSGQLVTGHMALRTASDCSTATTFHDRGRSLPRLRAWLGTISGPSGFCLVVPWASGEAGGGRDSAPTRVACRLLKLTKTDRRRQGVLLRSRTATWCAEHPGNRPSRAASACPRSHGSASNLTSIVPAPARSRRMMNRSYPRIHPAPGRIRGGRPSRGSNARSSNQRRPEGSFTPAQPRPIGEGPRRLARAGAAETSRLTSIGARLSSRRRAAATGDRDS